MQYYSLCTLFPVILLIASCIETHNSQSKESCIQNSTYYLSLYSAGHDFLSLNTSLVFLPGDTVGSPPRCVNISILNDDAVEANETFDVVVSSNSILQITGETSVPVTINDDPTDCEPFHYYNCRSSSSSVSLLNILFFQFCP